MTNLEGNIVDVPNPSESKKLPGVRELFEKPLELRRRRTRYDIYKRIYVSYYGYKDDRDGVLGKVEVPVEERLRAAAGEELMRMDKIRRESRIGTKEVVSIGAEDVVEEEREREREREERERKKKEREFMVHVSLPDEKEIEEMVLEKKMELLSKYASNMLLEEQSEAKAMLNIHL
ncbi:hypothetical protein P3X46_031703 [Hevea brasiliensis]|uniref:Uncharacterized protein n=1 Tax=Hevea brasiliensis TaxID=3981 RepID=A0ABQ9KL59_HEVBR|nr:hypothetical protein P3X46_031703 [Hevea brasiliensis]